MKFRPKFGLSPTLTLAAQKHPNFVAILDQLHDLITYIFRVQQDNIVLKTVMTLHTYAYFYT